MKPRIGRVLDRNGLPRWYVRYDSGAAIIGGLRSFRFVCRLIQHVNDHQKGRKNAGNFQQG